MYLRAIQLPTEAQINALTPAEKAYADKGEIINCLRAVRARTHCGLKEAKDAYEAYISRPREHVFYEATTVVPPQGNDYGCGFCTLEYLTGVPREKIAEQIGHDGSEIILPEEPKPYCHAALDPNEGMYWLHVQGFSPTSLVSLEYYRDNFPHIYFGKRYYPRERDLIAMLQGKAAELSVESQRFKGAFHSVAYLGGIVLDPKDGCVHKIEEYRIVGATFTNIDPYLRLTQIHDAQPKENVVRV